MRAAPAADPWRARQRGANIQAGPGVGNDATGRPRRRPRPRFARATIVRAVRMARLIERGSGARWDTCLVLAKHYLAEQGLAVPKDLLLH
ncbi:hypothetical protein LCGC14_1605120 [marine sediment metagenome]|uniref:Uncharacterized protein n=1 Tax=marine sediment metagenome TaxID=412755 RepID=A0A0F9I9Z5_9ZZZZ